jgi:hypothetical protein
MNPHAGDVVTLTPTGGTPPYYYQKALGGGTISGNTYQTTPVLSENVNITVRDSSSPQKVVSVTFSVKASTGLADIKVTDTCPAGYDYAGTYQSTYVQIWNWSTVICTKKYDATSTQIITDIQIAQGNNSCPNGYVNAGSLFPGDKQAFVNNYVAGTMTTLCASANCGDLLGSMSNAAVDTNQSICVHYQTAHPFPANAKTSFSLSLPSAPCASGDAVISTVDDCPDGICYKMGVICGPTNQGTGAWCEVHPAQSQTYCGH